MACLCMQPFPYRNAGQSRDEARERERVHIKREDFKSGKENRLKKDWLARSVTPFKGLYALTWCLKRHVLSINRAVIFALMLNTVLWQEYLVWCYLFLCRFCLHMHRRFTQAHTYFMCFMKHAHTVQFFERWSWLWDLDELICLFSDQFVHLFRSRWQVDKLFFFLFCYIYIFLAVAADTALFCLIEEVGITGWVAGFSVRSVSWPCWPLSPAYRKPPGTKDLQSALFSLAKTLPKHTPPLPHTQNTSPNEGLTEQLGTALIFIYPFRVLTQLDHRPVRHLDPSCDWLETCCVVEFRTELLPGPKAHLLWLWLIYCWPRISVFFVSNRWNVRWLSDPTCWASHPSVLTVKRALQANRLCPKSYI